MKTIATHCLSQTPGLSRLFLDLVSGAEAARPFASPQFQAAPPRPAHWPELVSLLATQNPAATASLDALRTGAGAFLTGQQVGLFGGPLYVPMKAATALARAREATAAGAAHVGIFWLATEDHDFAEIDHGIFPARRELRTLRYANAPRAAVPAGGVPLTDAILPLIDEAYELLGPGEAMEALAAAYRPGKSFGQAFGDFYRAAFAAQGLLVVDPSGRDFHRLGAPVLASALERADELHAALLERNAALQAAGYHAQVAVTAQSSLLFLIDEESGARLALKRTAATPANPSGEWSTGRKSYTTDELLAILAAEPERISSSALLRPVFQDFLFGTSATIGGPAEVAYFAQSAVLFERILGRVTPGQPRFSATLVETETDALLRQHHLTLPDLWRSNADALTQQLALRALPQEGRETLQSAGDELEKELEPLLLWMSALDADLGRSARVSASKMRYQMGRLRRLAANFQLRKEESLGRAAQSLTQALFPHGMLQERVHGAAYALARHGFALNERLVQTAQENPAPAHLALSL